MINAGRHRAGAFTLIELLTVIVILVVMSAFLVPQFSGGTASSDAREAVDRLGGMMNLASSMAAADAQVYRLAWNDAEGRFWIEREPDPEQQPGHFAPMRLSNLSMYQLPKTVHLRYLRVAEEVPAMANDQDLPPFIEFRPDGTSEKAVLVLDAADGDAWTLLLSAMTSRVRVLDFAVEEEEA